MKSLLKLIFLLILSGLTSSALGQVSFQETRVTVQNGEWELVGDLTLPNSGKNPPVVLMLNKAAGDRTVYAGLARQLALSGIASLRLDLRGHGESINVEKFVPYKSEGPDPLIWDAEADVNAAIDYLKNHSSFSSSKIAVVGASYSGEEMAEAGRMEGYVDAYVALSPGSFSDESIAGIDASDVPWLFIVSRNEPHLKEITAEVQKESESVELIIVPGKEHATRLLPDRPELNEWIAIWLLKVLK
ncbi:MAG: CocE/NonD family hydrolase [Cyclobacteriaceae bacterium]